MKQREESASSSMVPAGMNSANGSSISITTGSDNCHPSPPSHGLRGPMQIPLEAVAKANIVEGPAIIRSENGRLLNYVDLNVRGRDIVGFVDEAQRAVIAKVKLPEDVHIEWSGEFENQVRAACALRFVFPAILIIFIILYLTYKDLADADLTMLAVPEALADGAFFQFLFQRSRTDGTHRRRISASPSGWARSSVSAWPPRPASSCLSTCANP